MAEFREEATPSQQSDASGASGQGDLEHRTADFLQMARDRDITLITLAKIGSPDPDEVVGGIKTLTDLQEAAQLALGKPFTQQDKENFATLIVGAVVDSHTTRPVAEIPKIGKASPSWSAGQIDGFLKTAVAAGLFKIPGVEAPPSPVQPVIPGK